MLSEQGKNKTEISKLLKIRRATIINWLKKNKWKEKRGWNQGKRKYTNKEEKRIIAIKEKMVKDNSYLIGPEHVQMHYSLKYPSDRIPSKWFISEVVRNNNLQSRDIVKRRQSAGIVKRLLYPIQSIIKLGTIQQSADFIGKKFILKRKDPISFFATGYYQWLKIYKIWLIQAETVDCSINCLKEFWIDHPLPQVLRIDNALTFRGAGQVKARLGKFVKFLLNLDITPLFSAPYKSYTNPHIEGNNSTFARKVWVKNQFTTLNEIENEIKKFNNELEQFYQWKFKERLNNLPKITNNSIIDSGTIYSTQRKKIAFIRYVEKWSKSDQYGVVLLNKFIRLSAKYNNQYVLAEINLETSTLHVYSEYESVATEIHVESFKIGW